MKIFFLLCLVVIIFCNCKKDKKYCWECNQDGYGYVDKGCYTNDEWDKITFVDSSGLPCLRFVGNDKIADVFYNNANVGDNRNSKFDSVFAGELMIEKTKFFLIINVSLCTKSIAKCAGMSILVQAVRMADDNAGNIIIRRITAI